MMRLKPVGLYQEMYKVGRHDELPSLLNAPTGHAIDDREQVLEYMRTAPGVLDVLDVLTDMINNTDKIQSASSLISDGEWIWRVDSIHYLSRYNLYIHEEFLQHVRARNYEPPQAIEFTPEFESEMLDYF